MKQKASDIDIKIPKQIKKQHLDKLAEHREKLRKNPDLRTMFIEMTLNCNEHCRHCGSKCGDVKMEDQLTGQEIKDFLFDLKGKVKKLPFLNITGGEPLLREDLCDIMKYAHEIGYNWGMTTNGLLLTKEKIQELLDAGIFSISISIDGLKDTHDWFRNKQGGYEKAIFAVKNIVETKAFGNVMVTTVVHKKNINELEELYKIVKELGIDTWRVINVDPIGRALEDEEIRLETKDYKYIIDFIQEKRKNDMTMEVSYGCNHFLGPKRERELRSWYFLCTAGIYTGGIFYNGDIGACLDIERRPETIQGNIKKDDFYEIWLNKFEVFRKDRTLDSPTCKDCKHKNHCQGSGYHTWDIENKVPRICMLNEIKKAKNKEKK